MSSPPPLVIDTNSALDKGLQHWLARYHGRKVLPSTAYAELAFVYIVKYGDTRKLDRMLRAADVDVDETHMWHGRQAAQFASERAKARADDKDWDKHWKDYLIGAHAAFPPWKVVTNDPDFAFLHERRITPFEFVERMSRGEPL